MEHFYLYAALALVIALPTGYILATLFSKKNKGAWDEPSRLKGQMRSEGWQVRDTVSNLARFIAGAEPTLWPLPTNVAGVDAIRARREDPEWAAVSFVAPGYENHLFFAFDVPLRSDATEVDFNETLVQVTATGLQVQVAGAVDGEVQTAGETHAAGAAQSAGEAQLSGEVQPSGEAQPRQINDAVLANLRQWPGLEAAHFLNQRIVLMFAGETTDPVARLKSLRGGIAGLIHALPDSAWQ